MQSCQPAVNVGSCLLKLVVKVPHACAGAPVRVWLVRRIFGWRLGRLGGHIHSLGVKWPGFIRAASNLD